MGGRVQKVVIDAGFSCPNRDGTVGVGGCTFCNNDAFSPSYCRDGGDVRQQIDRGIAFHAARYRRADKFLAYFQPFSNTHAPLERLRELYEQALSHSQVVGLIIGTRPDCVEDEKLDYLADVASKYYVSIEYGVESCYDATLSAINRGHDFACTRDAIRRTAERGIHVGAHFIIGLPGETREMILESAQKINSLPLTTVKFHQLQIFSGTAMAEDYALHPDNYSFYTLEEYLDLYISLLQYIDPEIVVERFISETPERYQAGPTWGTLRNEELIQKLERRLEERNAWQGQFFGR